MKNIAITGSFASGKSYVIEYIQNIGYKTFSCDEYVSFLYQSNEIQNEVLNIIKEIDEFDKQKIANIIYGNEKKRKELENFIHPLVRNGIKIFEEENKKETLIFTEVPLLFESGFNRYFYSVICVFCSEKTRFERAKSRGIKNFEIFEKINKIQLSQEEKKTMSEYTINTEEQVETKLIEIINQINNDKRNNS